MSHTTLGCDNVILPDGRQETDFHIVNKCLKGKRTNSQKFSFDLGTGIGYRADTETFAGLDIVFQLLVQPAYKFM
uniref:Uncharacterized protein n=1 Tax=Periophthalmus magnuspinnatus TaxID=409849 RepID=A0A3B4AS49_9GOBI